MIWILGAGGRVGRAVAARLRAAGQPLTLAGRRPAEGLDFVGTLDDALAEIKATRPAVVVHTVGPYTRTAAPVLDACPPGTHYVDVANELTVTSSLLDRHFPDRTVVTGAGFGVYATESLVLHLRGDRPPAARTRVDAIASVGADPGRLGAALAGTIADGFATGGRAVRDGRVVPFGVGAARERLTTPDGDRVSTAAMPTGELIAAWRAAGADHVTAASVLAPPRAVAATLGALLKLPAAEKNLSRVRTSARERPRTHSWAHAHLTWPDGTIRAGWLRAGEDAMDFTASILAEVARRLAAGEGRPGPWTPGALFGPSLAEAVGGAFLPEGLDAQRP